MRRCALALARRGWPGAVTHVCGCARDQLHGVRCTVRCTGEVRDPPTCSPARTNISNSNHRNWVLPSGRRHGLPPRSCRFAPGALPPLECRSRAAAATTAAARAHDRIDCARRGRCEWVRSASRGTPGGGACPPSPPVMPALDARMCQKKDPEGWCGNRRRRPVLRQGRSWPRGSFRFFGCVSCLATERGNVCRAKETESLWSVEPTTNS